MVSSAYRGTGLVVGLLLLTGLAGCSLQKPTPDQILSRSTLAMTNMTSFHYDIALNLNGKVPMAIARDVNSASVKLSGDASSKDLLSPQFTLQADLSGTSAQGQFTLKGEVVDLSDYTYFRLTNLSMPTLAPVTIGADSRWYKVRHLSPADPAQRKLGTADISQLSADQLTQLRESVSQLTIASVLEVLPEATVNNQRSYHYKISLNEASLRQLVQLLNSSLGLKLSSDHLNQVGKYQPEIWINKRTSQVSQFKLADLYLVDNIPLAFDLALGIGHYNEPVKILVPTDTEELDTEHLLKGKLPF